MLSVHYRLIRFFFLAFVMCIPLCASAQKWEWARSAGGKTNDQVFGFCTDKQGNSYIAGRTDDDIGITSDTLFKGNGSFVLKYNTSGDIVWTKWLHGSFYVDARSIGVDASGNCFVTGAFAKDFYVQDTLTLHAPQTSDIFIIKYDSDGNFVWAKSTTGGIDQNALGLSVDPSGNFFIVGNFTDSISFGGVKIVSPDRTNFLAKYNSSGNCLWAKKMIIPGGEAEGISADSAGNCFVTGFFSGGAAFDTDTLLSKKSNIGSDDVFIVKYSTDGKALWARGAGGSSLDRGAAVCADKYGNCYATGYLGSGTGYFDDTIAALPRNNEIYLAKYEPDGKLQWVTLMGPAGIAMALCTDNEGNVILTGGLDNTWPKRFDTIEVKSNGVFIAKYNAGGRVVWVKQPAGGGNGNGVAIDSIGNCYLTGGGGDMRFDSITLKRAGAGADIYIAKLVDLSRSAVFNTGIPAQKTFPYPNPTSSLTSIILSSEQAAHKIQVKIYDVLGRDVSHSFDIEISANKITIQSQQILLGVYHYKLFNEDFFQSFSIIGTGKFILQ